MAITYQLVGLVYVGSPVVSDDTTAIVQSIKVRTGIMGDPYGLYKEDIITTLLPNTLTIDQAKIEALAQANAYIDATYPDIV